MENKDYELACYKTDFSGMFGEISGVVYPKNVGDVKNAIFNSQSLVPRGLGNSLVGGCVPSNSVVMDMRSLDKTNFDLKSKTVHAEAGVSVKELNERLKAVNYELPFFGEETIGGMIAINSPSIMGKYGNIKDWIEEVDFVNGRGEVVKFSKSDLGEVCGLEGTTGIITSAKINVIPYVDRSASIFQSADMEEIFIIIRRLRLEKSVSMIRLYSPYFSKLLGFPEKYNIIVGFDNDHGKIRGEEYNELFEKIRKDHYKIRAAGFSDSEDPKFLIEKIREFIVLLNKFNVPFSADFQLGIVFPYFDDQIKRKEILKIIDRMNGRPGKYGVGLKKKDSVDNLQRKIIRRIKMRHDPFLKMNNGKLIDIDDSELIDKNQEEAVGSVNVVDNLDRESSVSKSLMDKVMFNNNEEGVADSLDEPDKDYNGKD